jgi:hypothetical protein
MLLVSVVANKFGKDTDFSRKSQTFCPLFYPQHNKSAKNRVIISDDANEDISSADSHAADGYDGLGR